MKTILHRVCFPIGLATTLAVFLLMFPTFGTQNIALGLDWVFAIVFPHYNLGSSIMNIYTNYQYINTCERSMYQVTCKIPALSSGSCCMGMLFIVIGMFDLLVNTTNTPTSIVKQQ